MTASGRAAWRLRVYPVAVIAALLGVVVLAVLTDTGTTGGGRHLGGDYPAFYAAGSIGRAGEWDLLYDAATQRREQADLVADGGLLYFAYPPAVAAAYVPLAAVPYRWSYLIHTALMAAALWGAVAMARRMSSTVDRYPAAAYAALLAAYPLWRAVTGGQNTALTLLLVLAAAQMERERRWGAAGAFIGLLLFKPQFGVVFIAMLLVRRRWRAVAAAAAVAAGMWTASALVAGAGWFPRWLDEAREFAALNADLNSAKLVSLPGALGHALGDTGSIIGWAAAAALGIAAVVWWRRSSEWDAAVVYAITAVVMVLVLPQPLFYEVGLVVLLGVIVIDARRGPLLATSAFVAATWLEPLAGSSGGVAMMVLTVVALAWSVDVVRRRSSGLSGPASA